MTVLRMDHVGVVVDDLSAAVAFFVELGLEVDEAGSGLVEEKWLDLVVGLEGVRVEVVFVRTPDGHGRLELTKFHQPAAGRQVGVDHPEYVGHPPHHVRRRRHR